MISVVLIAVAATVAFFYARKALHDGLVSKLTVLQELAQLGHTRTRLLKKTVVIAGGRCDILQVTNSSLC